MSAFLSERSLSLEYRTIANFRKGPLYIRMKGKIRSAFLSESTISLEIEDLCLLTERATVHKNEGQNQECFPFSERATDNRL